MKKRLDGIIRRYEEITSLLSDPDIVSDIPKMTALAKEQSTLEKIVSVQRKIRDAEKTIAELTALINEEDSEIRELAESELDEQKEIFADLETELRKRLIPDDPDDDKNVIVEIRGAAGGDEANIFAGDLYRMYLKYAETKDWKVDLISALESEAGGFSQIEFSVSGERVYAHLKYESGAHRVQRVPVTESQGRIHTSTSTVIVLPEAEDIDVDIQPGDVRIDTFRSSGAGGQHVNTTDSAVRVTHMPSGIVVTCQDGKSQHENKATALKVLRARVHDKIVSEQREKEGLERRSKLGSGDRSEKIRTYNYPQNRVTDHRIGYTLKQLDRVMDGKLDAVIDALIEEELKRTLESGTA